jgi:hypothetical protein
MPQVTLVKVVEGPRELTVRFNFLSDGSGELVNYPILSPQDLNPPRPLGKPTFRLLEVWYGLVWFDVTFSCGTLSPVTLLTLARDCDSHIDFQRFGGIPDQNVYANPPALDDGKLLVSTNGFSTAGSQGTIILTLGKLNA